LYIYQKLVKTPSQHTAWPSFWPDQSWDSSSSNLLVTAFITSENMERLRTCSAWYAREGVKMILLTNDAEGAVKILKKNFRNSETILEQLLNEVKCSKDVSNSKSFQEFSNLVWNLSATVES
jgi:hypothetical protein